MTLPTGPILFNASAGGSDTAASGHAATASLSGTGASTNNTTAVDVSADVVDTSSIAAGDILWVDSTGGPQFAVIASVDTGTDIITCDVTFTQTEGSRNWGVGGKRATLTGSTAIWVDFLDRWIIELEAADSIAAAMTLTGTTAADVNDAITIRGSSGSRKTITMTGNASHVIKNTSQGAVRIQNLKLAATGTRTTANGIEFQGNSTTHALQIIDCELGDATNQLNHGVFATGSTDRIASLWIDNCYIHDCVSDGVNINANLLYNVIITNSMLVENGGAGFDLVGGTTSGFIALNSSFSNNVGDGISSSLGGGTANPINQITNCTFEGNGSDGFNISNAGPDSHILLQNNIFSNNGGYGIAGTNANILAGNVVRNSHNCFYNNTTANVEESDIGTGDNAVTSDPLFTARTTNDFSLQSGSPCKAAGFPGDIGTAGLTTGYLDIGSAQRQEPAGGASSVLGGGNLDGGFAT